MSVKIPEGINGRLIAISQLQVKPGKEATLEGLLKAVRAKSAHEAGTEIYRISKSTDGQTFFVYQEYTDLEAGKKHLSSPELQKLQEAVFKDVLSAPPQLQYFGGMAQFS
ncbi:hypothetical protein M413DRAFT_32713 [Hebeloma cylindrosporum]|uniref:ABM domain-containing protein n=1 Tax=Hebeloma cylindrosporum TaxID=76867 RepID=A0A0C2Y267_HEBCY|nr:hypothetical protein M413DRAFT_32713 [Hebeloma cylindrosporum h7]